MSTMSTMSSIITQNTNNNDVKNNTNNLNNKTTKIEITDYNNTTITNCTNVNTTKIKTLTDAKIIIPPTPSSSSSHIEEIKENANNKILFFLHESRKPRHDENNKTIKNKLHDIHKKYKKELNHIINTISNEYSMLVELEKQLLDNNKDRYSISKEFELKLKYTIEASEWNDLFLNEFLLLHDFDYIDGLPCYYYEKDDDNINKEISNDSYNDVSLVRTIKGDYDDISNNSHSHRWILYKNTKDINKFQQFTTTTNKIKEEKVDHDYESSMQIIAHAVRT